MTRPQWAFTLTALLLAPAGAFGQGSDARATALERVPLTYVGGNARISLGIDDDGRISGEALGILGYDGRSAWLLEGWLGEAGAGGLKFGRHWIWGGLTPEQAGAEGSRAWVAKGFLALDQNRDEHRKLTLGGGAEREDYFVSAYLSRATTDERFVGQRRFSITETLTGTQDGRPFRQERITTTVWNQFEAAYDTGFGLRLGRYFDADLWRLRGGLDYERGDFDADQLTASLGVDKYLRNTGSSFTLQAEHLQKSGVLDDGRDDTRVMLLYRYEFGQTYRPALFEHRAAIEAADREAEAAARAAAEAAAKAQAKPAEARVIRNEASMSADAFFEFDRAELTAATRAELDRMIEIIRGSRLASPINIVGHTCDIGSERYNQGLSERRARAVEGYFRAAGVEAEFRVEGKGELEPKYPNDGRANRAKNRRVDVTFITVEERDAPEPAAPPTPNVRWQRTPIDAPPAWIERALRNPTEHKRQVDTYRYETSSTTVTTGPIQFINRPPVAVDDSASVRRNSSGTLINVLANDSDPDPGDRITVTAVTTPSNGTVQNVGNGVIYTPRANFVGSDAFSYTIADSAGLTATARVTVNVVEVPPVAQDDSATTPRNTAVTIDVLANDRDPGGTALTLVSVTVPANGRAEIVDNRVRYTPNPGFGGTDGFSYTVRNAAGSTATARVTVTVTNRAPTAVDDAATTVGARPVSIDVLANDSDPEGDALAIAGVGTPANGTARIDGTRIVYQARVGFSGVDSFTYTVRDAFGATATATVRVTVQPNLPPVVPATMAYILKGQSVDLNVLANARDPEGDPIAVTRITRMPTQGTAALLANNVIQYRHTPGTIGEDVIEFEVTDGQGNTVIGRAIVYINRIPSP